MEHNHVWIIEIKIGDNWYPILESVSGVTGVRYTRAEARQTKQNVMEARKYKTHVQYRIVKYQAVSPQEK